MNKVYNKNGTRIREAFDKDASWLASAFNNYTDEYPFMMVFQDASSGTDSGYDLTSGRGNTYVLRTMVDLLSDGNLQSLCYDYDNNKYYRFDASTTVIIYDSSLVKEGTITMPSSAGHNNDACFHNGLVYLPGGNFFDATVEEGTKIYIWNPTTNTVTTIQVQGIVQPANGSTRIIAGACEKSRTENKLYLVCQDCTSNELVHLPDDKLSVYELDLGTNTATLMAEYPWECVYLQGATFYDGIIYVACNTQTTGSAGNYKGVTIKVIRTDIWSLIDELICEGVFEPEGMDVVPADGGYEIEVGLGHYGTISLALRFTAPYATIKDN